MKTINTMTQERVKFTLFPDNQPHVDLVDITKDDMVHVICPLRSSMDIMHLLQISNALMHIGEHERLLTIPYLLGARYDRSMKPGDSFDLEVVASLINSCYFDRVRLFDVHSPVALKLIHRSENISNRILVEKYPLPNAVLICPDKGAQPKVTDYLAWNHNFQDTVSCEKKRDQDGRITLTVNSPERCRGRNCVIIDDICDGGGTFLAIAEQIEPASLTLIVTHGLFSKGLRRLMEKFGQIITSDSVLDYSRHPRKQVIKIDYESLTLN